MQPLLNRWRSWGGLQMEDHSQTDGVAEEVAAAVDILPITTARGVT